MELLFFRKTLFTDPQSKHHKKRIHKTENSLRDHGERGDIVFPLILSLMAASALFFGLFLFNTHYEHKTKDHLNDFQNSWNDLEKKYQN